MSYVFFDSILTELGHKLTYDAVVNYAGNSFCEKSWDMIMKQFPLKDHDTKKEAIRSVVNMFARNAGRIEKRKISRPKLDKERAELKSLKEEKENV